MHTKVFPKFLQILSISLLTIQIVWYIMKMSLREGKHKEEGIRMKKFVAVGHWDGNQNTTSVAMSHNSKKDFALDLICNGFRAYVVLTEKTFNEMKNLNAFELYEKVKKQTSNYRKWATVTDYIEQCADIMENKLANAE